ncbi:tyrosine-type recombinase/integrase [Corallococcus exercitus]|uniref:Tyrosine-type recombinase/integrase n=1 Tax=Corallococcus exercitus TaxID=2316736 RepID=A0A7Y4NC15_9BACT|nr:tyrosine-type recombinase/integrase [Corallococcus exercitus]
MRAFFTASRRAGQQPSTLNRRRAGLSNFFAFLVATGHCRTSPVIDLTLPSVEVPIRKALSITDLRRFLRTVREHGTLREQAICELLFGTGIREDEFVKLQLQDLAISERQGSVHVRGKGFRERTVPLNVDTRRILSPYLQARPSGGKTLFPGRGGKPRSPSTVWRIVARYQPLAGIAHVSPHVLRHTFATDLLRRKGVNIVTVQRLLGHASLDTTQLYTAPNLNTLLG